LFSGILSFGDKGLCLLALCNALPDVDIEGFKCFSAGCWLNKARTSPSQIHLKFIKFIEFVYIEFIDLLYVYKNIYQIKFCLYTFFISLDFLKYKGR
jgi:hypothetical protein